MPEFHAKLSPSAAERWMNCPGSVVLCADFPEKTSEYAAEGTLAHAVAEAILLDKPAPAHPLEMNAFVKVYTDHIHELAIEGCSTHIETEVSVTDDVWGTADAIVWDPVTATLYVRDLKYGAGVPVGVTDNLQLKIYALAALLTMGYKAKIVNVGIVQPRINHEDGCIRSKDYDVVDLLDFHADLMGAVENVRFASIAMASGRTPTWCDTYLNLTEKGCRWCLAAPVCPKMKNKANELAKKAFTPDRPYDPDELASTLDFLDILEAWIKNTREFAYGEAEKGFPIPHYKLVEKRATQKWKADVLDDLASLLGRKPAELLGPAPMLSVTDIRKMCPGKNDKERSAFLEPFTTKESSGHALVHESDKREAVRIDAKAAFAESPTTN